jgi:hypothetical protein
MLKSRLVFSARFAAADSMITGFGYSPTPALAGIGFP